MFWRNRTLFLPLPNNGGTEEGEEKYLATVKFGLKFSHCGEKVQLSLVQSSFLRLLPDILPRYVQWFPTGEKTQWQQENKVPCSGFSLWEGSNHYPLVFKTSRTIQGLSLPWRGTGLLDWDYFRDVFRKLIPYSFKLPSPPLPSWWGLGMFSRDSLP